MEATTSASVAGGDRAFLLRGALMPLLGSQRTAPTQSTTSTTSTPTSAYRVVDVLIDSKGRIAAVDDADLNAIPSKFADATPVSCTNQLLLPGFVNGHTHSSEVWSRGLVDMYPLELWLACLIDYTPTDLDSIYWGCLLNGLETLKSGGTTVMDHLSTLPGLIVESVGQAAKAYKELGIRAFIAPLLGDLPLHDSVPLPLEEIEKGVKREFIPQGTEETLKAMEEAILKYHSPKDNIFVAVGPTGIQRCSDAFYKGCVALSEKYDLARHTHCLETRAQKQLAQEKYGCTAVEQLKKLNFLGPKTSCAHSIWLTDNDIGIFAETGTTAVHNPLSNIRLGSGLLPLFKYRDQKANVAFGCDGSASNDGQDLLEAIKIGTLIHNPTEFDYRKWLKPHHAVEIASLGGAIGVGLSKDLGTIEVGKLADLVLFDLTNHNLLPRTDPLGLVIMGRSQSAVQSVWVSGKRVIDNAKSVTVNEENLRRELFERSQWHLDQSKKPSPLCDELEPIYRRAMGLPE